LTTQSEEINQYLNQKGQLPLFTSLWAKLILFMHIYAFFTVFFFLGIAGFPQGVWLTIEVITEIILFTDFFVRILIRKYYPKIWQTMWVLHDKGQKNKAYLVVRLAASIPTSILVKSLVHQAYLHHIGFAVLRSLKLLRMR